MGDPLVTCMKHITYSNVYDKRTKVENFRIDKHKFMLLCNKVRGKGVGIGIPWTTGTVQ